MALCECIFLKSVMIRALCFLSGLYNVVQKGSSLLTLLLLVVSYSQKTSYTPQKGPTLY